MTASAMTVHGLLERQRGGGGNIVGGCGGAFVNRGRGVAAQIITSACSLWCGSCMSCILIGCRLDPSMGMGHHVLM